MTEEPADTELCPPSPERVAARTIVFAAVACRGAIEQDADDPGAEDLRKRVWSWLEELGLLEEAEERERRVLSTSLGSLSRKDRVNASWRSEGMVVLAWALRRAELPAYHEQCEPSDVANPLGFLDERESTLLAVPQLRPSAEIEHWADTYLTLHWRLRQFSIDSKTLDFVSYVASCKWGPLTLDELEVVGTDLAIGGVRVDAVSESEFQSTLSITQERHQAFNWLLGEESVYSQVTTDT